MYTLNNTDYWIIVFLIYVFSFFICWRWMHITYSKNGRWETLEPRNMDIFLTVTPFINTIFTLGFLFIGSPKKYETKKSKLPSKLPSKFFITHDK